jgi:hypothetical protein
MPKKWSEVIASPEYSKLSPQDQFLAKKDYFDNVVAPKINNQEDIPLASKEFFGGELQKPITRNEEISLEQGATPVGNVISAMKETGSDLATIPSNFVNQALYNAPRSLEKKITGTNSVPYEPNSPVAHGLAHIAGVAGAIVSPINKIGLAAKGAGLGAKVVGGAVQGALYSPDDFTDVGARGLGAIAGGVLGSAVHGAEKWKTGLQSGAERIYNSIIAPLKKDFAYAKNPGRGLREEGMTWNNYDEAKTKVSDALEQRTSELHQTFAGNPSKIEVRSGIDGVLKNAENDAARTNNQSMFDNVEKIRDLLENVKAPGVDEAGNRAIVSTGARNLDEMSLKEALELKRRIGDITNYTGNPSDIKPLNAVKQQLYRVVKNKMEEVAPETQAINERIADLIGAKNAMVHREAIENRRALLGITEIVSGAGGLISSFSGHTAEGLLGAIAMIGLKNASKNPAVMTRLAKLMNNMSEADIRNVLAKAPQLVEGFRGLGAKASNLVNMVEGLPSEQFAGSIKGTYKKTSNSYPSVVNPEPTKPVFKALTQQAPDVIEMPNPQQALPWKRSGINPEPLRDVPLRQTRGLPQPEQPLGLADKSEMESAPLQEGQVVRGQGFEMTPYSTKAKLKLAKGVVQPEDSLTVQRARERAVQEEIDRINRQRGSIGKQSPEDVARVRSLAEQRVGSKPEDFATAEEYVASKQPKTVKLVSAKQSKDYMGGHEAPMAEDINAPIWDLTGDFTGKPLYPKDVYEGDARRLYSSGSDFDNEAMSILQSVRKHPNAKITIYRAVPKDVKGEINAGDWVTITRGYAKEHGESNLGDNFKIVKKEVFARDIFTDANSIQEFGYDPQSRLEPKDTPYELLSKAYQEGKVDKHSQYQSQLTAEFNAAKGKVLGTLGATALGLGASNAQADTGEKHKADADKYLKRFPKTPITAEMLQKAHDKALKETGVHVPIELVLAQAQFETKFATEIKRPGQRTNPFNVGEEDKGTTKRFKNIQDGIDAYYSLMARKYLKGKNVDGLTKNFVNDKGQRYASDKKYEQKIGNQIQFIKRFLKKKKH